jgi:exodeoxyribonuclease VII small subunit
MPRAAPANPASPESAGQGSQPVGQPASYEDALRELEQLVQAMESSALPLDRLLDSYRRAGELLEFCKGKLQAVEQQVKVLEDGQLKAWNPQPTTP